MAQVQIQFQDSSQRPLHTYLADRRRIPGASGPFNPFPPEIHILTIAPQHVHMNRIEDDLRGVLPLREARAWALEYDEERLVYAKAQAADGRSFCLRFLFNAKFALHDKHSENYNHYLRMLKDADNYVQHSRIAGVLTPPHYGLWAMDTGAFAGMVLVSITRWGGQTWHSLRQTEFNTEANRILVGRTLEMLHDTGLEFNGGMGSRSDLRHVLLDLDDPRLSKTSKLEGHARCYIVGLSDLREHVCDRKLPSLPLGRDVRVPEFGCREIRHTSFYLDFLEESPIRDVATDAIQWLNECQNRHQSHAQWALLVAQRNKWFAQHPAVYSNLTASVEDDTGEMVISETVAASPVPIDHPASNWTRLELATRVFGEWTKRPPAVVVNQNEGFSGSTSVP
ncbi:hypothetical protein MKEN_00918400 [Mycena kentingensis (nom. inval.)]|nr:hypothetical protein MKEN_00918400 [Mycena kentingensis (nom. inval.)]